MFVYFYEGISTKRQHHAHVSHQITLVPPMKNRIFANYSHHMKKQEMFEISRTRIHKERSSEFGGLSEPPSKHQTGFSVEKTGVVINHNIPWIPCSPDGIARDQGRLIEVKCSEMDKTLQELKMAEKACCVTVENCIVYLKPKHKYYGQVQLGMIITNLGFQFIFFKSQILSLKNVKEVVDLLLPMDPK